MKSMLSFRQIYYLFPFFLFLLADGGGYALALANPADFDLVGDFENNGMPGRIIYRDSGGGIYVEYKSQFLNKTFKYSIDKFDECSSMSIYKIQNTRRIAIDGSCSSNGGQIYRDVYEWNSNYSNWCLVRRVTGERADVVNEKYYSSERVARVSGCATIGSTGSYGYESVVDVRKKIQANLSAFRQASRGKDTLRAYLSSMAPYDVSELAEYVDSDNVADFNNIAYFLIENGRSGDAIALLEEIVKEFPDRIVAKLNLADAYWNVDIVRKARKLYGQYYDGMISKNMGGRIPSRVIERIK